MLNGKELGRSIKVAIDRKIAAGTIKSVAEVARHFSVKPPSVYGWIKTGAISKDKLPELWSYFADVAGPAHWGLASWPSTSSPPNGTPPDGSHVSPALTPTQQALLGLFDGLTESQQRELLRSAEAKKQENDAVIEELVKGRKEKRSHN